MATASEFSRQDRAAHEQNRDAEGGERIVPPIMAAMPIDAQRPGSPTGICQPANAPSAPPMISNGASHESHSDA